MENIDRRVAGGACACLAVVIFISSFLIGFSFRVVDYDEYGILYNQNSNKISDDDVYDTGRHFVGLGNNFHHFPKTFQNIEFSDSAAEEFPELDRSAFSIRATDGQQIELELSFQYQLNKGELKELFSNFQFNFEKTYVKVARGRLRDVASTYESEEFFLQRDKIEAEMEKTLSKELNDRQAILQGFQLRNIALPYTLDQRLLTIQLSKQEASRQEAQENTTAIQTESQKIILEMQAVKNKLLATLTQETENERLTVEEQVRLITERTAQQVKKISTDTATEVTLYEQETQNQLITIAEQKTIIEETTEQQVKAIEAETSVLEARNNGRIVEIESEAAVEQININVAADLAIEKATMDIPKQAFQELVEELGLELDDGLLALWSDVISEHSADKLYIDLFTPEDYSLPGQSERIQQNLAGAATAASSPSESPSGTPSPSPTPPSTFTAPAPSPTIISPPTVSATTVVSPTTTV